MEEFLSNISQNRTMLYFLIIFAVLWGGGMIWGILLVLRHLGKKSRSLKALKSMGFVPVNGGVVLEEIKSIFTNTLGVNFARRLDENPRKGLMRFEIKNGRICVTYNIPEEGYRDIPRAVGLKAAIQIIERKIVLSRLLFMPGNNKKAFYARTDDIETIRAFQEFKPINKRRSTVGWVICFYSKTKYTSTISIHKKFTGHRKYLLDMAFKIANLKPVGSTGLLPEFANEFKVQSAEISGAQPLIDEKQQQIILEHKRYIPEGIKLFLSENGVWLTGEEWLDNKQIRQVVDLCNNLLSR